MKDENMKTVTINRSKIQGIAGWTLMALAFIIAGFACDGLTETGHHLLLILGGIVIGSGITMEVKRK